MASQPPTVDERDANLDALKEAVDEWANSEKTRYENENKFMREVLEGRGADATGTTNLAAASALLQDEIDEYLVGTAATVSV